MKSSGGPLQPRSCGISQRSSKVDPLLISTCFIAKGPISPPFPSNEASRLHPSPSVSPRHHRMVSAFVACTASGIGGSNVRPGTPRWTGRPVDRTTGVGRALGRRAGAEGPERSQVDLTFHSAAPCPGMDSDQHRASSDQTWVCWHWLGDGKCLNVWSKAVRRSQARGQSVLALVLPRAVAVAILGKCNRH